MVFILAVAPVIAFPAVHIQHPQRYGKPSYALTTIRVAYVISPTTQLNDVVAGWINLHEMVDLNSNDNVAYKTYKYLNDNHIDNNGTCSRAGRGQASVDCINGILGNVPACKQILSDGTKWLKIGSGHKVTPGIVAAMLQGVYEDIGQWGHVAMYHVDGPASGHPAPGSHTLYGTVKTATSGKIYNVGDPDMSGTWCLFDVQGIP